MARTAHRFASWSLIVGLLAAGVHAAACGSTSSDDAATDDGDGGSSSGTSGATSSSGSSGTSSGASSGSSGTSGDVAATSITVDPPSTTLDVSGATPKTVQLVAHAQPSGAVITPTWTLDNPAPGSIAANGLYTTSNAAAGVVNVTATYKGLTAQAQITVKVATDIKSGAAPANAASLFDPTGKTVVTTGANVPSLVYPVNDTMFPQNIYRVLHQWRGKSMPLFQLEFTSPLLKLSVYTDGVHATCTQAQTGGSCWESDAASWTALAASNAGQAVTLKIRSVDSTTAPTTIYESPAYTVHFSKKEVPGAIYYWSTTVAGVRRGAMGDPGPTNFLTPAQAQNKCVACHTVSKNGALMAADIGGESLGVVQVSNTVPPPVNFGPIGTPPTNYASAWATFDPAAKLVVQSKNGVNTLRDATTGATVGGSAGVIPLGTNVLGVQPDWSWDGNHIVFAANNAGTKPSDRGGGPTIQALPTTIAAGGVTYGTMATLLPAAASTWYGYPMYSPTNEFLSFVKATGNTVEKNLTDQVWLVKAASGQTPVNLTRANTLVSDSTAPAAGVENNMATWAPTTGPDVQWIAFASQRDYGFVLCSATGTTTQVCKTTSKIGSGVQQIWIAAIDVSKLGTGVDPSYPAFRVPFMDLTENCHRPFWALDVLKGTTSDAGAGGGDYDAGPCTPFAGDCSSGRCCDGLQCIDDGTGNNFTCKYP